jgi:hypothetical protein
MAQNSSLNATGAILKLHQPKEGRALVVGSKIYDEKIDRRILYKNSIGLDMQEGEGVDIVHDFEQLLPLKHGNFAHIDCCSVLEHVKRPWKMAEAIEEALEPEGTLLVIAPFIWRQHAYPNDYWRFTPDAMCVLFPNIEWIEKRLWSNGAFVSKAPKQNGDDGQKWMGRTETVMFGIKCASKS